MRQQQQQHELTDDASPSAPPPSHLSRRPSPLRPRRQQHIPRPRLLLFRSAVMDAGPYSAPHELGAAVRADRPVLKDAVFAQHQQEDHLMYNRDSFLDHRKQMPSPSASLPPQQREVVRESAKPSPLAAPSASSAPAPAISFHAEQQEQWKAFGLQEQNSVARLSMFHVLETNSHTVFAQALLPQVLDLLLALCRHMSLQCTDYHHLDNSAPTLGLSCQSMEHVELEVYFWRSRCRSSSSSNKSKSHDDEATTIVLEIQKVSGDSMYFQHYAQQILAMVNQFASSRVAPTFPPQQEPSEAAAMECDVSAAMAVDRVLCRTRTTRRNIEQHGGGNSIDDAATSEALEILHNVLFCSDRFDAHRLGLESACIMTDPIKTGWSTAASVAQTLLAPTTHVQQQVSNSLLQWVFWQRNSADCNSDAGTSYASELSYLALQALAQALQVAVEAAAQTGASASGVVSTFLDVTLGAQHDLIALLLDKIRTAQQYPHTAYFAVRALTALCQAVPQVVRQRIFANHVQDVEYAQQVGAATHQALAAVSGRLLVTLSLPQEAC